jgi:hypothetical protein
MVDGWTFNGCTSLEYCVVPATVLKIGQSAFEGCSALKDLTILGSVELDQHALKDCSALKSIYYCGSTLSLKPTSNEWQIFQNTDNPVIYTKSSALSTIIDALNGKADWIKDLATDEIPYIPAKQYTTFCRDFDVDFSAATGLKAGVATTDLNGTMLKLIVKTSIPAGTGVVLKKLNEGEYKLKIAEESPEAIVGNKLVGVVAPTAIPQTDGDNTNFVLKDGVFKKVSADNNTLPAGKAYLQLTTSSTTRSLSFSFEDDVTGIDTTTIQTQTEDGHCYNLAGLHVGNSTKGLYIINGKKVVVK